MEKDLMNSMEPFLALRDYDETTPSMELTLYDSVNFKGTYLIRVGTLLYHGIEIGDNFVTGNNAIIRANTIIGDNVLVGTNVVIEGECTIGNNVKLQTGVYITLYTTIENNVFMGPRSVTTNDKYMIYENGDKLIGPTIKRGARIGAGAIILPGIIIGENAIIGSGSVVTKNVPDNRIVYGNPAQLIKSFKFSIYRYFKNLKLVLKTNK